MLFFFPPLVEDFEKQSCKITSINWITRCWFVWIMRGSCHTRFHSFCQTVSFENSSRGKCDDPSSKIFIRGGEGGSTRGKFILEQTNLHVPHEFLFLAIFLKSLRTKSRSGIPILLWKNSSMCSRFENSDLRESTRDNSRICCSSSRLRKIDFHRPFFSTVSRFVVY